MRELAELLILGLPQAVFASSADLFSPTSDGRVDYQEAVTWARRAAEAGAPEGQATLAYILSDGPVNLRDLDAAFEWYRKSAEQNYSQGQLGYAIGLINRADTQAESSRRISQAFKCRRKVWLTNRLLSPRLEYRRCDWDY